MISRKHNVVFDGTTNIVVPSDELQSALNDGGEFVKSFNDLDEAFDVAEELNEHL